MITVGIDIPEIHQRYIDYWHQLPKVDGRCFPSKKSFKPFAITSLLPHIVLQEIIDDDNVMYRLSGTAVDDMMGQNITGLNALDFVKDDMLKNAINHYKQMLMKPCGAYNIDVRINELKLKKYIHMTSLPLADDNGAPIYRAVLVTEVLPESHVANSFDQKVFDHNRVMLMKYFDLGEGIAEGHRDFDYKDWLDKQA